MTPESSDHWNDLISGRRYRQYYECKAALLEFTERCKIWHDFLRDQHPDGAIVLGGGAPSKDMIVLRSMLAHVPASQTVDYTLIDFSLTC